MEKNMLDLLKVAETHIIVSAKKYVNQYIANHKVIPDSWLPVVDLIVCVLKVAELFVGPELKPIITEILLAIAALED